MFIILLLVYFPYACVCISIRIVFSKRNLSQKIVYFLSIYVFMQSLAIVQGFDWLCIENQDVGFLSPVGASWYLLALCIWYVVTPILEKINLNYLIVLLIVVSLIIGYDKNFGDFMVLSRVIVYSPFFLMGVLTNRDKMAQWKPHIAIKILSVALFAVIAYVCITRLDYIYDFRPLLTGRNSYYTLDGLKMLKYGWLYRLCLYLVQGIMLLAFLCIVPRKKFYITRLGSRTMSAYALHMLFVNLIPLFFNERLLYMLGIGVMITIVLLSKPVYRPFEILYSFMAKDTINRTTNQQ